MTSPEIRGVDPRSTVVLTDVELRDMIVSLRMWVKTEEFIGWDPYDALKSPLLRFLSFRSKLLSILWVQLLKSSPVNLRPLLGIEKAHNPKGQGLLLAAYLRLYRKEPAEEMLGIVDNLSSWLETNVVQGYAGACWGFNFDWPNRSFFAPAGTPTVVNTAVIAGAFLDGYELLGRRRWLEIARSACDFVMNDLNRHEDANGVCFSYTPLDHRRVHNANVLGAELLERVAKHTSEPALEGLAERAVEFTVSRQRGDGSWVYGEDARDGWVDNYHTGMLLDALESYRKLSGVEGLDGPIQRGLDFYVRRLFLDGYIPKFTPARTFPIDIHCVAQAILTLFRFQHLDPSLEGRTLALVRWAQSNMLDAEGFFHYQVRRLYRIRTPYMRWGQAWMLRALAELNSARI
ncbi:MAG: hypothetical protein V3U32_06080 [Anaerolineales bacterium]